MLKKKIVILALLCIGNIQLSHLSAMMSMATINNDSSSGKNIRIACIPEQQPPNPHITIKHKQQNVRVTLPCVPNQLWYQNLPVSPGQGWMIYKKKRSETGDITTINDGDMITFEEDEHITKIK